MKKFLALAFLLSSLTLSSYSQRLGKPTLTGKALTPAQLVVLGEGVALHDKGKFAEAITKYRSIIAECPDCVGAIYELALSLNSKGDKIEAIEVASNGTKYIADELPLFYVLIANNFDDIGKPEEAIKIYQDGLENLKDKKEFGRYRSSLYFNLGITHFRQKRYTESREAFKSAVENDFSYASPHYLLSIVYNGTKYKVPALLAASRFVALEYKTERSQNAVKTIHSILAPASKDPKTGKTVISLDFNSPKDEGDFTMFDLILGTITTVRGDDDKGKSDNQMFIEGIGSVIAILDEDKKLKKTFIGKVYVPYMTELKRLGHLDAFGNLVLLLKDSTDPESRKWLEANEPKLKSFLDWAKAYNFPEK